VFYSLNYSALSIDPPLEKTTLSSRLELVSVTLLAAGEAFNLFEKQIGMGPLKALMLDISCTQMLEDQNFPLS